MSYETIPESPPFGYVAGANLMDNTLSEGGQWIWIDGQWIENSDYGTDSGNQNPIVEADLEATLDDRLFFQNNPEEQYVGFYHRHQNNMLMTGAGMVGFVHDEINPDEIIFKKIGYEDIQETRERVSDLFYKLWFQSNTLTEQEILSMQTTIRDGIKQTGRGEDEPLVFYKKDRNTLESRKDLQGDTFEQICQYIFDNQIDNLNGRFHIATTDTLELGEEKVIYNLRFTKSDSSFIDLEIATKVGDTFTDVLNLSQLTKVKTSTRIDPVKAREVLDTNIFELLPNQSTRQQTINSFFNQFNELIGQRPAFDDVDDDGVGESPANYQQDMESRISFNNDNRNAFITRLDEQASGDSQNQGKTLESMRNKLNTYLGDVDNVISTLQDNRPEYENKSEGFLKIRKPNQAIILRAPDDGLLELQKNDSYLVDGFTITMWVRFVNKTSEGTLFNFGNPLESDGVGFRLDTKVNEFEGQSYRYLRLMVRDNDGYFFDNHFAAPPFLNRFDHRSFGSNETSYPNIHEAFPNVSTNNLNEWFFICATYNPNVLERNRATVDNPDITYDNQFPYVSNKEYWLNHVDYESGGKVAFSAEGAKCKVETISRSELLNARGFRGSSLEITAESVMSGSIDGDIDFTIGQVYEDPSLLDGDGNGNGDSGSGSLGGGNLPTAGFSKADMDWRTYEVGDIQDTTETETTYQG